MSKIVKIALVNALGTAIYIALVASFIFSLQNFQNIPQKTVLIPIAMLLLFVFSAALTGMLVFGRPIMWYLNGKKKEAVVLIAYTLLFLLVITAVVFCILIYLI